MMGINFREELFKVQTSTKMRRKFQMEAITTTKTLNSELSKKELKNKIEFNLI